MLVHILNRQTASRRFSSLSVQPKRPRAPAIRLVKSSPDRGGFRICPCFSEGLSFSADDCDDGGPVLLQD